MEKLLAKSNRIHVFPGSLRVAFKKCQYQQNSGRCSRMSTRRWQFQRLFASDWCFGNTRQSPRWRRSGVTWASSTVSRWLSEHGRLFQNMAIYLFERSIECALNVLYFNKQNNSNSIYHYEWISLPTRGRGPGRREFLKGCVAHFHDEGKWKKKE